MIWGRTIRTRTLSRRWWTWWRIVSLVKAISRYPRHTNQSSSLSATKSPRSSRAPKPIQNSKNSRRTCLWTSSATASTTVTFTWTWITLNNSIKILQAQSFTYKWQLLFSTDFLQRRQCHGLLCWNRRPYWNDSKERVSSNRCLYQKLKTKLVYHIH